MTTEAAGRRTLALRDDGLEAVRDQIEHWRRTRTKRSAMPEPLWQAAVMLARKHGLYATVVGLRVSYDSLKARLNAKGPQARDAKRTSVKFVELAPAAAALPMSAVLPGAVVELWGPKGQRLSVRLSGPGGLDVAALVRECWGRQT